MYDPMHVYTVTWLTTDMYMDKSLSEYTNIKMKINKTIYLLKYVHIFVQDLYVICNVIITWVTETRNQYFTVVHEKHYDIFYTLANICTCIYM